MKPQNLPQFYAHAKAVGGDSKITILAKSRKSWKNSYLKNNIGELFTVTQCDVK